MPTFAPLNHIEHKQLRVILERGASYGDAMMTALSFPDEFRLLQSTYPIVFGPSEDGKAFDAIVLFGFERGENLFLGPDGWDAPVLPLSVERIPFLIGQRDGKLDVHVDLDSPRLSSTRGERVFLANGTTTEYTNRIVSVLRTLHDGLQAARGFTTALMELNLIESFVLDVELEDGSEHRLEGYYTINEDRLRELPGETLARLAQAGYLQPIYMAIASLSQFRGLIERRNRKLAA
jgi:hypothetical protein